MTGWVLIGLVLMAPMLMGASIMGLFLIEFEPKERR